MVISLVCFYGYALHGRTRYDSLDNTLLIDARHIAAELSVARSPLEIERTLAASLLLGVGARVYDASGLVVQDAALNSSALPALDPRRALAVGGVAAYPAIAALAPAVHPALAGTGAFTVLYDADGERWRAYVLPIGTQYLATTVPLRSIDSTVAGFGRVISASPERVRALVYTTNGQRRRSAFCRDHGAGARGESARPAASRNDIHVRRFGRTGCRPINEET